ncbi:hypothetical protein MMC30_009244 [Trapelia coarctata]|nr:hypothetical protein [Trapelia coarctata]
MLRLELLRSCRQVYAEANTILWESNTFVFNERHTFNVFFKSRPPFQKQLLKKLRFHVDALNRKRNDFRPILSMAAIEPLRGLRTLHIRIQYDVTTAASEWPTWGWSFSSSLLGVLHMQILPLETATVIVMNDPVYGFDFRSFLSDGQLYGDLTTSDELAAAEGLRNQLLDPNGLETCKQIIGKCNG